VDIRGAPGRLVDGALATCEVDIDVAVGDCGTGGEERGERVVARVMAKVVARVVRQIGSSTSAAGTSRLTVNEGCSAQRENLPQRQPQTPNVRLSLRVVGELRRVTLGG